MGFKNFNSLFLTLFFVSVAVTAQNDNVTVASLFKKVTASYNAQDYLSFYSHYRSYKNHTATTASEEFDGVILKKNGVYYYKINTIEFLNFKEHSLKISNNEKAVVIGNAQNMNNPLSLNNDLKGFTTSLSQNKKQWICTLSPAKVSQIMFNKMVIYINKSDYSIAKQVTFLAGAYPSKDANGKKIMETPRMEVSFSPRPKDTAKDNKLVDQQQYFINSGGKLKLSKRFSTYKLYKS